MKNNYLVYGLLGFTLLCIGGCNNINNPQDKEIINNENGKSELTNNFTKIDNNNENTSADENDSESESNKQTDSTIENKNTNNETNENNDSPNKIVMIDGEEYTEIGTIGMLNSQTPIYLKDNNLYYGATYEDRGTFYMDNSEDAIYEETIKHIYEGIDVDSFKLIQNKCGEWDGIAGGFGKDKYNIYFLSTEWTNDGGVKGVIKLDSIDTSSAIITKCSDIIIDKNGLHKVNSDGTLISRTEIDVQSIIKLGDSYYKDNNNVYYHEDLSIIENADAQSFRNYFTGDNKYGYFARAIDKNNLYIEGNIIPGIDRETVTLIDKPYEMSEGLGDTTQLIQDKNGTYDISRTYDRKVLLEEVEL